MAVYGRDTTALTTLKKDIQGDIDRRISAFKGKEYEELIKTLRNYWHGSDCEDFIADLNKKISNTSSVMTSIKKQCESIINDDLTRFKQMQSKNAR